MFETFLRRNLEFVERESSSRADDMDIAGLIAQGAQAMGELTDQLRGTRELKKHQHHKAKDLTGAVIDDIAAILTLRKKVQNKKE